MFSLFKSTHYFSAFKNQQLCDVGNEIRGNAVLIDASECNGMLGKFDSWRYVPQEFPSSLAFIGNTTSPFDIIAQVPAQLHVMRLKEHECMFAHLRCSYFLSQWYNSPTSLPSWLLRPTRFLAIVLRCLSVCLIFLNLRSDPVQGRPLLWWVRHLKSTKRKTKIACNFTV